MKNTLFLLAYKRAPSPDSTLSYMGSLMTFLAEGEDSGGSFALMEYLSKPGNEPPPHLHERENELLYILEGKIEAYVEKEAFKVGPREGLLLPKLKPHAFSLQSPRLRMLILVQPARLDRYFRAMGGTPAQKLELPDDALTHFNLLDAQVWLPSRL